MLDGRSLVYYSLGPWYDLARPQHQLVSVFARQNKVLFCERYPYLRSTLDSLRRGRPKRADLVHPCLEAVSKTLHVYRPPVWACICGYPGFRSLSRLSRRFFLTRAMRRLGMSYPIVWFSMPGMIELYDDIPSASLRLYHVIDEYAGYHGHTEASRRRLEQNEQAMMAMVDAVVVVSESLYQAKSAFNPHTWVVRNGVDYRRYADCLADPRLPERLEAIPPPRLGYIGLLGEKVDLGLLEALAVDHPEWSLVFLSAVKLDEQAETWQAMRALPNVYLLDPVPASQVPDYVKGFQVGLMPYVADLQVQNSSPLKLYDYMAAGIPIVSVDMPPARRFESLIHLARGPQTFAQAVSAALQDTSPERCRARREVAAQNSWDVRVEQLSGLIEERLASKALKRAHVPAVP